MKALETLTKGQQKALDCLIKGVIVLVATPLILGMLYGALWLRAQYWNDMTGGDAQPLDMIFEHVVTE